MRVLGVIGSSRKLGNTELLVTQTLHAAALAGLVTDSTLDVRLLRLTELRLAYCSGCMRCADEGGGPCPLDDDMEFLLSEFDAADALVFGVPAYTLLPPGPVKLIADRLIMALGRGTARPDRPAVTLGVAGLPRWSELMLPFLNGLVMAFGFRLIGSALAYAAGPGEVLLSPPSMQRASELGTALGRALAGEAVGPAFGPGRCPVCGADFFRLTQHGVECPLCLATGELVEGVPRFDPSPPHRWEPAALEHHFKGWIQGTLPEYLEHRPEIRRLQKPFRGSDFTWVKPPRAEAAKA